MNLGDYYNNLSNEQAIRELAKMGIKIEKQPAPQTNNFQMTK